MSDRQSRDEQGSPAPFQVKSLAVVRNQRRWLSKDLDRLLTRLHDPSILEDEIRACNVEANAVLGKRRAWDSRLVELGGILEPEVLQSHSSSADYIYFGRAKELPEAQASVADPIVATSPAPARQSQSARLYQLVDADYYGMTGSPLTFAPPAEARAVAVAIPSREEMEQQLLEAKKSALLKRINQ